MIWIIQTQRNWLPWPQIDPQHAVAIAQPTTPHTAKNNKGENDREGEKAKTYPKINRIDRPTEPNCKSGQYQTADQADQQHTSIGFEPGFHECWQAIKFSPHMAAAKGGIALNITPR